MKDLLITKIETANNSIAAATFILPEEHLTLSKNDILSFLERINIVAHTLTMAAVKDHDYKVKLIPYYTGYALGISTKKEKCVDLKKIVNETIDIMSTSDFGGRYRRPIVIRPMQTEMPDDIIIQRFNLV